VPQISPTGIGAAARSSRRSASSARRTPTRPVARRATRRAGAARRPGAAARRRRPSAEHRLAAARAGGELVADHEPCVDGALGRGAERRSDPRRARLEAGRSDQNKPPYGLRVPCGRGDRDGAAERVPDEVEALDADAFGESVGDPLEVEARTGGRGLAEAGDVDGDHAPPPRQRLDHAAPDQPARRDAVQQHERLAVAVVVAAEVGGHRAP